MFNRHFITIVSNATIEFTGLTGISTASVITSGAVLKLKTGGGNTQPQFSTIIVSPTIKKAVIFRQPYQINKSSNYCIQKSTFLLPHSNEIVPSAAILNVIFSDTSVFSITLV